MNCNLSLQLADSTLQNGTLNILCNQENFNFPISTCNSAGYSVECLINFNPDIINGVELFAPIFVKFIMLLFYATALSVFYHSLPS